MAFNNQKIGNRLSSRVVEIMLSRVLVHRYSRDTSDERSIPH